MHNNANNSEMLSRSYRAALKKNLVYFLFALPAVIYVISLSFYPAINVVYDSFIVKDKFSLANYTGLPGENLYPALIDTLIVSVGALLIQLMFALAVAMIMIKPFRGNKIFSTIVIIPFGISTVVSAWVFSEIFSAIGGYANSFLILFGHTINWHATITSELGIVMFSDFWKNTPLIALILFGGLSSISPSMYEAAAVDGAGPFKRFLHITLPAIAPLMGIALLIRGVSEFNIFALPLVLVGYSPSFMNTLIYSNYESVLNVGFAYSASVILLVIIMIYAAVVLALGGGPKYAK